jgi:hypothetical protein
MGLCSRKNKNENKSPILVFDIEKIEEISDELTFARQLNNRLFNEIPLKYWCPGAGTFFLTGEMEIQDKEAWCIQMDGYASGYQVEENFKTLISAIQSCSVAPTLMGYNFVNKDTRLGLVWDFDIMRDIAFGAEGWSYHVVDREGHGNEGHDFGLGYSSFCDVFGFDTVRQ